MYYPVIMMMSSLWRKMFSFFQECAPVTFFWEKDAKLGCIEFLLIWKFGYKAKGNDEDET